MRLTLLKGLSLCHLASTDTKSLGPKWTGHPTALLFELRAGIPWEVATAAAATALSAWPPKRHGCFLFPLECLVAPVSHGLCCLKMGGGFWGEEPEADSAFVLKVPAVRGPPSS